MPETPYSLFEAGRLADAVPAAIEAVKKQPTDKAARAFLAELFCFAGDLERADKQLETLSQQDPQSLIGFQIFRQLIRAETYRAQCFEEGAVPEFLFEPSEGLKLHLKACIALRAGDPAEAATLLAQAESQRPHVSGVCDGVPFDDLRDLDDVTASFFEVAAANGKYYWVPIERVEAITFQPAKRASDLIWRAAKLSVAEGPEGDVFFPAIYPATRQKGDDQLRLGRGTSWFGGEGSPVQGLGLRTFMLGDRDKTILELREIKFQST